MLVYILCVCAVFLVLTTLLGISVRLGYRYGVYRLNHHVEKKLEVVSVAETSVLGLLGLLIAFTFSGAYDRYENRKLHFLEEVTAFSTAYDYIDLVSPLLQPKLREQIRHYLDIQLRAYHDIPNMRLVKKDRDESQQIQNEIWKLLAQSGQENPTSGLVQLYIPAITHMFDEAKTGLDLSFVHPPAIIFELLIGLALLGGFLVGYTTAEAKEKNSLHVVSYILLTAFTIFVILNLEFPRVGFLRFSSFDHILESVKENMK